MEYGLPCVLRLCQTHTSSNAMIAQYLCICFLCTMALTSAIIGVVKQLLQQNAKHRCYASQLYLSSSSVLMLTGAVSAIITDNAIISYDGSVVTLWLLFLQDIMRLDNTARMNIPGKAEGNWAWRVGSPDVWQQLSEEAAELQRLAYVYNRLPKGTEVDY